MSGLFRRLLIFSAVDALVLQPAPPRNHKPSTDQAIKISYDGNSISPLLRDRRQEETAKETLESFGIVGLLKVASSSYLISISRREQVALIGGKPVYTISEIALIPLTSQAEAEEAIVRARRAQFRHSSSNEEFLGDSSESEDDISIPDDASITIPDPDPESSTEPETNDSKNQMTSVAQDVIHRQGFYGRFTDKWFSKKGWTAVNRSRQGMGSEEDLSKVKDVVEDPTVNTGEVAEQEVTSKQENQKGTEEESESGQMAPTEVAHVVKSEATNAQIALLPKLLATTKIFLGSKSFFFSYDHNLSRNVKGRIAGSQTKLHENFDEKFFWNKHLLQPLIDAGQVQFTVPLIQGFVGQREFTINTPNTASELISSAASDQKEIEETVVAKQQSESAATKQPSPDDPMSKSFLLTLISRRSVDRAGLRYLRRGADEDGHVANSVETEQILCSSGWDGVQTPDEKLYSYVQYRGSMPLFFSQSPYSLKPIPVFRGTPQENLSAFQSHFQQLVQRYGKIQVTSLVEKKGSEGKVGDIYQQLADQSKAFSSEPGAQLSFNWFDFHQVCRGMKFENVSLLFDELKDNLTSFGWTSQIGDKLVDQQSGVLRTNCMDCLDRTNVVQSAAARLVLEEQLAEQGFKIDLQNDPTTSWFNTLWADNGDAISRQYAGTAALKGDFTRTRKRNISGALTDFGLTLNRYYNNIVNDYFTQAMIDFVLGRADESIFLDFEADMKSQDYAIDLRRVRQNAIETCTTICVQESGDGKVNENFIAGWALRCPRLSGTLKSHPFEECILLLTEKALYFCRMDWSTEKIKAFEKIELENLTGLSRGVYITNTNASRDMDEKRNVGFVIKYTTKGKDLVRVNTRSLASNEDGGEMGERMDQGKNSQTQESVLAFKALPPRSSYVNSKASDENPPSEEELTRSISDLIAKEANRVKAEESGSDAGQMQQQKQATKDVESPAAAKFDTITVEEKDIISLAEARRSTGYLEQIGYSLKKLVWA